MTASVEAPASALQPRRLALLEVRDRDGRLLHTADVSRWPLTLGRALDNEVVLVDPHVAAHHARIDVDAGGAPLVHALASRNGVRVEDGRGARLLRDGERARLVPGSRLRLGHTQLTLRLPGDPLAAEQAIVAMPRSAPLGTVPLLAAIVALWTLAVRWLGSDPDARWLDYLVPLLAVAGGLATWVLAWALLGKLFTGRFVVRPHLLPTLAFALAIGVVEFVLPALAFMFDWPLLSRIDGYVAGVLVAVLVTRQLLLVVPQHARAVRSVMAVIVVFAAGFQMVTTWQQQDRLFGELYAPMLLPPGFRVAAPQSVDSLTRRLGTLEQPLIERVRRAQAEDQEP